MAEFGLKLFKRAAFEAAQRSGFNALVRSVFRKRLVVLCYHSIISDDAPSDPRTNIAVTRSQFELQLRELVKCFTPVTADQVVGAYCDGQELPSRAVLVTFDDGYRNNLDLAAPLLLKYKIPAIFFVTTGYIGSADLLWGHEVTERIVHCPDDRAYGLLNGTGLLPRGEKERFLVASQIIESHKRRSLEERMALLEHMRTSHIPSREAWKHELYRFMTWDDVRTLSGLGFEIGAHTVDHPILSSLTAEPARRQIVESKHKVEAELGLECRAIAYPYGSKSDFTDSVLELAAASGFKLGFTLGNSLNSTSPNPLAIGRVCITRDITLRRFQARISGL